MIEWIIVPLCAWLWRKGGSGNKDWRRFGIPVVLITTVTLGHFSLWNLVVGALYVGAFRLPFTLIGDDINQSLLNWIWIPVWAGIQGASVLLLSIGTLYPWLIGTLIISVCAILSNIKETREIFTWPRCEYVFGAMVALPVLFV